MRNYELKCQYCGKMFNTTRKDAKYCSDSCRVMASRERNATPEKETSIVKVSYTKEELNQLKGYAKAASTTVENIVKQKSLISFSELKENNRKVEELEQEVNKLKAHLSVYTKAPGHGIFFRVTEEEKQLIVDEIKNNFEGIPFDEALVYAVLNYHEDIEQAKKLERAFAEDLFNAKKDKLYIECTESVLQNVLGQIKDKNLVNSIRINLQTHKEKRV